jgi:hypothetical protein
LEFVSRQPFKVGPTLNEKVAHLFAALDAYKLVPVPHSPRTSIHVHCNIQDLTPRQVWNVIFGYWLIEPGVLEICGPTRQRNHFCISARDASGVLGHVENELTKYPTGADPTLVLPFSRFDVGLCKYGSLNLATIHGFNSLEFRSMRGVYDQQTIVDWSVFLHYLVQGLASKASPSEIVDKYKKSPSKQEFLAWLGLCGPTAHADLKGNTIVALLLNSLWVNESVRSDRFFRYLYSTAKIPESWEQWEFRSNVRVLAYKKAKAEGLPHKRMKIPVNPTATWLFANTNLAVPNMPPQFVNIDDND